MLHFKVLASNLSHSSSFHPFLPHLSPLLPKPKSEIPTKPNCSTSPFFTNNASPLSSSSQAKAGEPSSTKLSERAASVATTVDASTSTRLRPSSLKMKARAKQLRLLSGRALATECGVGFVTASHILHKRLHTVIISGETLCWNNCQLIGMSLIGLARQVQKTRD